MSDKKTVAQEIVEKSGNSFHSGVVELLRDEGWSVLVSPYYSDNFTDKPREIDVIAEKKFDVYDYGNWIGTVNVRLFIECKYITSDVVFWLDKKDMERAIERTMQDSGLEHPSRNITIQNHHYLADMPVAKLFASDSKRNEENEMMSKAINQNLNAIVYYRNRGDLKLITTSDGYAENVLKYVSYPLIVVNSFDKFHKTPMSRENNPQPMTAPFQLEVNYAYKNKDGQGYNEYFLIDVVGIDKLPLFLADLTGKSDIPAISQNLVYEQARIRAQNQRQYNSDNSFDPFSAI